MDEAYVGGKPRKRNRRDDDGPGAPRGRATSKTPIVGAVERGGRVKTKMIAHDEMTADDMEAMAKRAIIGQFHHVSRKYLPLYLRELSYRYNRRDGGCDLDGVLHLAVKP